MTFLRWHQWPIKRILSWVAVLIFVLLVLYMVLASEPGRRIGPDARIKSQLFSLSADAESYFDTKKDYRGFCESKGPNLFLEEALADKYGSVVCTATEKQWAAGVKLKSGGYACADTTKKFTTSKESLVMGQTVCPPSAP
jgi:hypothetical protein